MTRRTPQGGPCLSCAYGAAPAGPGTGRGGYPPATRTRSDEAPPATLTSTAQPGGESRAPRTSTSEKAAKIV
eukprot:scaffold10480_cov57-Phaeocystis_antarctica.AAC.1